MTSCSGGSGGDIFLPSLGVHFSELCPSHTLSVSIGPGLELCEGYKDGKLLWCLGAADVDSPH